MPFRPFNSVTHLKPFDINRPFTDRSPALCGEPDKGTFFFLTVQNKAELDKLIDERHGKPYPLCLDCGIKAERAFE